MFGTNECAVCRGPHVARVIEECPNVERVQRGRVETVIYLKDGRILRRKTKGQTEFMNRAGDKVRFDG